MSKKRTSIEHEDEPYGFQGILDRMSEAEEGVHISDLIATHTLTGEQQVLKVIVAKGQLGEVLDEAIVALMAGDSVELNPHTETSFADTEVAESA